MKRAQGLEKVRRKRLTVLEHVAAAEAAIARPTGDEQENVREGLAHVIAAADKLIAAQAPAAKRTRRRSVGSGENATPPASPEATLREAGRRALELFKKVR